MKDLSLNNSIFLFLVWIIIDIVKAQSNECGSYCAECSFNTCTKCENNFSLDPVTKLCSSNCQDTNSYYYEDQSKCLSMCPYGYQEEVQQHLCTRNIECPQIVEYGNQFETILDAMLVDSTIALFQYSQANNTYYVSLFDSINFLILGNLAPVQDNFEKYYYDSSVNQLIISTVKEITYWNVSNWKKKNTLNLTEHESHILHVSYLDEQFVIVQDTTFNQFKVIYHSSLNRVDETFHEINLQGKIDIQRLFSDAILYSISGSKGFYMRSLTSPSLSQDSVFICDQFLPQSKPIPITINGQKRIFFGGSSGNIGTWDETKGCRMIVLGSPIQIKQLIVIDLDTVANKVKLLSLNSDSIGYFKINLNLDAVDELNVYPVTNPASLQYVQLQVYVIDGFGQQSILQIQSGKLVLLCNQNIAKHNQQKYLTTLFLKSTLYTLYTDSIASYDLNFVNKCSITFSHQLSNLKPYQVEQSVQISGVILDSNFQDQVLTYSNDGSIRMYQKQLINQRFQLSLIMVYYHPSCNLKANTGNASFNCYKIINIVQNSKQYIVVYLDNQSQYFASTWLRDIDSLTFKSDFKLTDQKRPLIVVQIYNNMFLIGNRGQIRVHNFSDGAVQKDYTGEYYFAAFDNIYGQNQIIVISATQVQSFPFNSQNADKTYSLSDIYNNEPSRYTYFTQAFYFPATKKLLFTFTIGLGVITYTGSYPSKQYLDLSLIRNFCYHPNSKQIFLQQLEYKRVIVYDEAALKSLQTILLAGTVNNLTCGLSSSQYFYYFVLVPLIPTLQNTVYVIMMPNMKVVFQQSFKEKVNGLYLSESELILYITFENGGFYSGRIFLDDLITAPTITSLNTLIYAPSKRYLAASAINNNNGQLTTINSLNLSVNSQVTISGLTSIQFTVLDEIADIMAVSSGKNIYVWKLATNVQPYSLQQLHQNTVTNLMIDGNKMILVSASIDFQVYVWDLNTNAKLIQVDYHVNDSKNFDNFKIDNIFLDKINNLMLSYNRKRFLYIHNYVTQKLIKVNLSQYTQIANFLVLPEKKNVIMITYTQNYAMSLYNYDQDSSTITFNEVKMIPINHQSTPVQMRFIDNRIVSYEISKVIVSNFQTFEVMYEIEAVNPKINDLVVSLKQNLLIIWSDCSSFCSPKVQIYNFLNGEFVIDVPYYNQIEEGLVLKVILDEDTSTLILVKYPVYVIVQFFNIETLQPSGIIFSQDVPLGLPIQSLYLIRETNNLVFASKNSLYVYSIEQRIGQFKQFLPQLRNQQVAAISNDLSNFLITDAFSEAWQYNNQNNQLACITRKMSNPLNSQVKFIESTSQFIYVILFDSIIQLDYSLIQLSSANAQVDKYIIAGDSIYVSDMRGIVTFYNQQTLKKNDLTITIDTRVVQMILVSSTSELLVLSSTNKIYRINLATGATNIWINSSSKIINILFDSVKGIVLVVGDDGSIQFFDQTAWKNSASQTIQLSSGKSLPTPYNTIRQVILDTELGYVLIINEITNKVNQINIYGYTITPGTTTLTAVVSLGNFSSISKLPFVNIKISTSSYLMFTGFQITWIDRTVSGFKINRFIRNKNYFRDILNIQEVESTIIQNSFFVFEPSTITLYYSVSSTELNKLFQHQCSFPKLLKYNISRREDVSDIEIQVIGVCGEGIFNDKVYIRDPAVQFNSINSCYVESTTQYQYQFDNKLEEVQFSLDMLDMNPSLLVIEQKQQTDFGSLDIGAANKNRTTLLRYRHLDDQQQLLNIREDYFSDYPYENLQIFGFTLNVAKVQQQIVFSSKIKEIVMTKVDVQFGNTDPANPPSPSITFTFENLDSVVLKDWTIKGQQVARKQPLLSFTNIKNGVFIDNLEVSDVTITGEVPTLLEIKNTSQVQINSLKLTNVKFETKDSIKQFIISLQNVQNLQMIKSDFISLTIDTKQLLLMQCLGVRKTYLNNIILSQLSGVSFIELSNYFFEGDQEMLVNDSKVEMIDIQAEEVSNLKDSFMFLNNTYDSSMSISRFTKVHCSECNGGVINILKGKQHLINDSQFESNRGRNGGVLTIENCNSGQLNIQDSEFLSNEASYSGGALYIKNSKVIISRTLIQNNNAMIGGGLRYDTIKPIIDSTATSRILTTKNPLTATVINNNQAQVFGNNKGSYLYSMQVIETGVNKITENQLYDIQKSGDKNWKELLKDKVMNAYSYSGFRSGDSLAINVQLLDEEGNPVFIDSQKIKDKTYDPELIQEISGFQAKSQPLLNDELKVFGQFQTDYSFYNKTIKSFLIETKIVSLPEKSNILLIQYSSLMSSNAEIIGDQKYSVIAINFRECIQGEVYQKLDHVYSCFQCPEGQYSLKIPSEEQQTCSRCPDSASKCFENHIILKEGFWRIDTQSEEIIECTRKLENCVPDDAHLYCKQGSFGPLCEECDTYGEVWGESYQTDGSLNCNSCKKLFQGYYFTVVMVQLAIVFLFLGISVAASIYDSKSIILGYYLRKMKVICISKSCYLNSSSYGLKNLTNFLQMISIIYQVVFQQFPSGSTFVSTMIGMPLTNLLHSFDCTLSTKSSFPIIYIRTLWGIGIAMIYFSAVSISLFIYGLIRKQSKKVLFYHGAIYTYFFLQSNITYVLFSMMSCRKIGDSYYVLADITQDCNDSIHNKFKNLIGIPGIIIWCFIIPFFLFFKMKQAIKNPDNSLSRETYGVLYNHYKTDYFYWEIVKFFKKVFLNAILVFYSLQMVNKFVFALLLQLLFLILLSKIKPHFLRQHYDIDYLQEFILSVKMVFCIYIQSNGKLEDQQRLLYYEIGLSSIFQFIFLVQIMKQYLKKRYEKHYLIIKKFIFANIPKCKYFFKDSIMIQKSNMKHLFYWKKVRIYVRNLLKQENAQKEETKDQNQMQQSQQAKLFKSYRSKLEDIGKTMKESGMISRKISGDILLLSPVTNSWRQNSEAHILQRGQSAQFMLQSQRLATDQMQYTEENQVIMRLDTEQVNEMKAKQPPQSNFVIHSYRQGADITKQSEDMLSPQLLRFESDAQGENQLQQHPSNLMLSPVKRNMSLQLNEESPQLIKIESENNETKNQQLPTQSLFLQQLQKPRKLQKQLTDEVQSPQLIRFDSDYVTNENQSPIKLLKNKSDQEENKVSEEQK